MSRTNTNAINIVTSHCEPEALHRPEPIRFKAPHGVQGEGRGNLVFIGCFVVPRFAGLLAMTLFLLLLY